MDYLKSHARAAAPALLVVSRHLASQSRAQTAVELSNALQPSAMINAPKDGGVLDPSLKIGEHLGVLRPTATDSGRAWRLSNDITADMLRDSPKSIRAFYSHLLVRVGAVALDTVAQGKDLSDVALGFVWLSQYDPLTPITSAWDDGPLDLVKSAGLYGSTIQNKDQWRPFRRWATALGLTTETTHRAKTYVTADCTKAIEGVLHALPQRAPADVWFRQLHSCLPVLGHPQLLRRLPVPPDTSDVIIGSTALAMRKLERMGRLTLVPPVDTTNAVVLRLGNQTTRIGEVHVEEDAV